MSSYSIRFIVCLLAVATCFALSEKKGKPLFTEPQTPVVYRQVTPCPEGYTYNETVDNCYLLNTKPLNFTNANSYCLSQANGTLPVILNQAENDAVLNFLATQNGPQFISYFLGLQYNASGWQWINGAPYSYNDFSENYTSLVPPACGSYLHPLGPNSWLPVNCYDPYPSLCYRQSYRCRPQVFKNLTGSIQSHGYPFYYYENETCLFTVDLADYYGDNYEVLLAFNDLRYAPLSDDAVYVYDGNNTNDPNIDRLSYKDTFGSPSNALRKIIGSSGSAITLLAFTYLSSDDFTRGGFHLNYYGVRPQYIYGYEGDISLENYEHNDNRIYRVDTQVDAPVTINVVFDTEANYDYLKIYNGSVIHPSSLVETYHGYNAAQISLNNRQFVVVWQTDGSVARDGFNLTYYVPSLVSTLETSVATDLTFETSATAQSTTYAPPTGTTSTSEQTEYVYGYQGSISVVSYNNNENKIYQVNTLVSGTVNINVSYSTEPLHDYLKIYNGPVIQSSSLVATYTGNNTSQLSLNNQQFVVFWHTDGSIVGDGFNLTYYVPSLVSASTTSSVFTSETTEVDSTITISYW